jgi:hypothetical protein
MTPASCDTFANLSNEATRISGQKSQHGEEAKMQVDALACSAAQFARSKINNGTVNSHASACKARRGSASHYPNSCSFSRFFFATSKFFSEKVAY